MQGIVVTAANEPDLASMFFDRDGEVSWTRCAPADVDAAVNAAGADPVAVVGVGVAGAGALVSAAAHGTVRGLVLWGSPLGADDIELIGEWPEVAVLGMADSSDRPGLAGATDAYLASAHPASDLFVGPLDDVACAHADAWAAARLRGSPRVEEVVFHSADGWELHGTRWLPEQDRPVPGAVLLHTGRSDRAAYSRLARLLADAGLAVLNFDWRGRGESINLGSYFDLSAETKEAAWEDALAAVEHLAAQAGVDAERIGMVGTVHGAEYAVRAAWRDPRVKAIVVLTGYRPKEPEEGPHLTGGKVDALYVTCTDHRVTTAAMKQLYDASRPGRAQYIEYPGAALGYQLFELDTSLEPRICGWLAEVLTR